MDNPIRATVDTGRRGSVGLRKNRTAKDASRGLLNFCAASSSCNEGVNYAPAFLGGRGAKNRGRRDECAPDAESFDEAIFVARARG